MTSTTNDRLFLQIHSIKVFRDDKPQSTDLFWDDSLIGCKCLWTFLRSLLPPPFWAFRSWLFYVSCIEIWSPKISHMSPAEFLGREIMYNKTIGKVISLHESCNFPAIDFLKITHCLRAVKANLTRRMSLFRTPWLAIVINSYNYYWLRGGFSFVKMLLKWQSGDGFKKRKREYYMMLPSSHKKTWESTWLQIFQRVHEDTLESQRDPHIILGISMLTENSQRDHSS